MTFFIKRQKYNVTTSEEVLKDLIYIGQTDFGDYKFLSHNDRCGYVISGSSIIDVEIIKC